MGFASVSHSLRPGRRLAATWIGIAVICSGPWLLHAQSKVNIKDLAPQYQEWWRLVTYLIKDGERDVFLHLPSDRDRNVFIDAFWKPRDPTPGTPQNEFKEEHFKRFQEANRLFRFGAGREGWLTDRGRIYIILGPPINRTYFAGSRETYPAESWAYYGDTAKGMPTHFELLFYQWRNAGEMKLYDPLSDTPARLLVDPNQFEPTNYQAMYQKIHELDPNLARVCLSIIPGEIPFNFQPSMETSLYLAAILDSPKKGLDDSYATHFLNFRGLVSTEYLTNYMNSEGGVAIIQDPQTGLSFCDFAIWPERLSVDYYEPKDEYSTDFQVDVSLRTGETIVLQYSKDYPMTIPAAKLAETENLGVCVADSFPIIEGKFKLTVLLRNTVGKEFSVLEREIEVLPTSGPPRLSAPMLGFTLAEAQAGAHLPFCIAGKKLNVNPKKTYASTDEISFLLSIVGFTRDLWKDGTIGVVIKGSGAAASPQKSFLIPLSGQPFHQATVLAQTIAAADLPPDYYEATLTLKDRQGLVLDEKKAQFTISPIQSVPHPIVISKAMSLTNIFMFQYMLAYQFDQTGQADKAEAAYKKGLTLNPSYKNRIPEYGLFLIKNKKYDEALTLIEAIQGENNLKFPFYYLRGRALMGLGRYNEAIESLRMGNVIYNSDAALLAALGTCYYKTGQKTQALTALKASLTLNPEQPEVKALIQEIEGKSA